MGDTSSTPIIHVVGPPGSGKTTLCRMFLDAFAGKSVLTVDASKDLFLTLSYGIQSPMTVGGLVSQLNTLPLNREAMDWALQDLPVGIPTESEAEILAWGDVPRELTPVARELLEYGLPRLFKNYDIVLWEGPLNPAKSLLGNAEIKPLIVITPSDEAFCQEAGEENAMVLLSKAQAIDILPPTAAFHIQKGNWKFIGKLPPLSPPEKRIKELPQYFQECFHKLDLPFELRPKLV
jgi:hypothetical protein